MKSGLASVDPRVITRWLRYLIYGAIIIGLWHITSTFSFVRLEKGDCSVTGTTGHHVLLVKKYGESEEPVRGEAVVFRIESEGGEPINRVARVAGLPGDRVRAGETFLEVNGEATIFHNDPARPLEGDVPEGTFLLLNDNLFSPFPDSRRIEPPFIPREVVLGRFVTEMPF